MTVSYAPRSRPTAPPLSQTRRAPGGRWQRLLVERGFRWGALILGALGLIAIFAEWIAADLPLLLRHDGHSYVLPAITGDSPFPGAHSDGILKALRTGDHAVWPLSRFGPTTVVAIPPLSDASVAHFLGTDAFGRDVLARLVYGTRASLGLGLAISLSAALIGLIIGALSGTLGGIFAGLLERSVETVSVFPAVVAIALVRALERTPSLWSLVIVVTAVQGASIARLTHVLVIRTLAEEFARGAKAMGATPLGITFRHVFPHLVGPLAVATVFATASGVLIETSLSFLDLGVPPKVASWGEMLGEIRWGAGPLIVLPPLVALGLTVGALYGMARALRRAFET